MQIIGTAGIYRFEPYDVLQIRKENWVDFSTIRTDTEAALAVGIELMDSCSASSTR